MPDFLLELLSEEIPARMQAKAEGDLARLFTEQLAAAGLKAEAIETYSTPRRLALIARALPTETEAVREETKGPRSNAPPQALEGFLRKTGLTREQLVERDGVLFALVEKPGRSTASVLAEAIPAIVRGFPWPKSMRWGEASASTSSIRWVRPLQGIVALLGEEIVPFEIADVQSGAATVGHRFHHPGIITIGSANDYAEKLRACHVLIDPAERRRIIADGARAAASAAGLTLVEDEGLLAENAGLTEWPVPLLGSFDPAFLEVPREVIQLTMRTNQKYFALTKSSPSLLGEGDHPTGGGGAPPSALRAATSPSELGEDQLAPNFICTANIEAAEGGAAIVAGNEKVLAARLSDAKFFWEQDLKVPLEEQAGKLHQIVFHEKLGTVADKVERVAKLARWLVEEGIVGSNPTPATNTRHSRESGNPASSSSISKESGTPAFAGVTREELALLAETAAHLSKADLVTGMVGEFPELQGIIGGYLARAQGQPDAVADAIRDHYKPVGQGDEVPSAPVTVAVSLADKLDTLLGFFANKFYPSGSRDPYALRRTTLGIMRLILANDVRIQLDEFFSDNIGEFFAPIPDPSRPEPDVIDLAELAKDPNVRIEHLPGRTIILRGDTVLMALAGHFESLQDWDERTNSVWDGHEKLLDFLTERMRVALGEAGYRHDHVIAVMHFAHPFRPPGLANFEYDLVRLLARVKALQSFVETAEGADLLAGYKRASNILKKEGYTSVTPADRHPGLDPGSTLSSAKDGAEGRWMPDQVRHDEGSEKPLSYSPEPEEAALIAALDSAAPRAAAAIEAEDFEGAMAALASLRAPVDTFFDKVTVNDPDPAKREARLGLLARMRDAVHKVADFSRIEG